VDKIMGTTVFIKIEEYGLMGTIATSEIASGRIRNIRDYVVPNKKIVCKVLRINRERENIDLSLRRVSQKDQKEILQKYSKEKASAAIIELVAKDKKDEIISKVKKEYRFLSDFIDDLPTNPDIFEKFGIQQYREKLLDIIKEKMKTKKIMLKTKISVSSLASDGVKSIKEIMSVKEPGVKITYISAPLYSITLENSNYKDANKRMNELIQKISDAAKKKNVKFEIISK
jgi:translation initiation factor 2 subunit 1